MGLGLPGAGRGRAVRMRAPSPRGEVFPAKLGQFLIRIMYISKEFLDKLLDGKLFYFYFWDNYFYFPLKLNINANNVKQPYYLLKKATLLLKLVFKTTTLYHLFDLKI